MAMWRATVRISSAPHQPSALLPPPRLCFHHVVASSLQQKLTVVVVSPLRNLPLRDRQFAVAQNLRSFAVHQPRSSPPRKLAPASATAAAAQESAEEEGGGSTTAAYSAREIWAAKAEDSIEKFIFDFRFLTLLAITGSLAGSLLCFLKGCGYVYDCFNVKRFVTGKVIFKLVEAVDVYLFGTVLLIFGMGVYGLFISNVSSDTDACDDRALQNTSLFGLFLLKRRPKWMCIGSLDELKTKLGHVIVMILLVKMFEKSKRVLIASSIDLLGYAVSIFLSSTSLYVLHCLHHG